MKAKSLKLYKITFEDHCVGLDDPIMCEIVGWLIKETETFMLLTSWVVLSSDDDLFFNNLEKVCILKSTIKKKKLIK